jgi:hypothetical protein
VRWLGGDADGPGFISWDESDECMRPVLLGLTRPAGAKFSTPAWVQNLSEFRAFRVAR